MGLTRRHANEPMIDYAALTFGHALLLYAFWHLFLDPDLEADPAREAQKAIKREGRAAKSAAGRAAARRAASDDAGDGSA